MFVAGVEDGAGGPQGELGVVGEGANGAPVPSVPGHEVADLAVAGLDAGRWLAFGGAAEGVAAGRAEQGAPVAVSGRGGSGGDEGGGQCTGGADGEKAAVGELGVDVVRIVVVGVVVRIDGIAPGIGGWV